MNRLRCDEDFLDKREINSLKARCQICAVAKAFALGETKSSHFHKKGAFFTTNIMDLSLMRIDDFDTRLSRGNLVAIQANSKFDCLLVNTTPAVTARFS